MRNTGELIDTSVGEHNSRGCQLYGWSLGGYFFFTRKCPKNEKEKK
jgi:hypothetical protein